MAVRRRVPRPSLWYVGEMERKYITGEGGVRWILEDGEEVGDEVLV